MSTQIPSIRQRKSPDEISKSSYQNQNTTRSKKSSKQSRSLMTFQNIHIKAIHIADKQFSDYKNHNNRQTEYSNLQDSTSKSNQDSFEENPNTMNSGSFLPTIKHQYPTVHAKCNMPKKNYQASLADVPEIRKAIYNFQVNDEERKKQFEGISNIFYDKLNLEDYLANEDNVKKLNTNSFINALEVYLPPTKKKTTKAKDCYIKKHQQNKNELQNSQQQQQQSHQIQKQKNQQYKQHEQKSKQKQNIHQNQDQHQQKTVQSQQDKSKTQDQQDHNNKQNQIQQPQNNGQSQHEEIKNQNLQKSPKPKDPSFDNNNEYDEFENETEDDEENNKDDQIRKQQSNVDRQDQSHSSQSKAQFNKA